MDSPLQLPGEAEGPVGIAETESGLEHLMEVVAGSGWPQPGTTASLADAVAADGVVARLAGAVDRGRPRGSQLAGPGRLGAG
mmetsp:Transcript_21434/g.27739  ORF Transcript_21434/g.27739 Transcript_21434/m.27739 type:complete len:82 (+) Transcript_21434:1660-1905(+)